MSWETGLLRCQRPDAPLSILICKRLKGALSRGSSASFHAWFTLICLIGHKDLETAHLSAENVQIFFPWHCCVGVWDFFFFWKKIFFKCGRNLAPVWQAAWVCLDLSYPSRKEFVKCCDCVMGPIYIEITLCDISGFLKGAVQSSAGPTRYFERPIYSSNNW